MSGLPAGRTSSRSETICKLFNEKSFMLLQRVRLSEQQVFASKRVSIFEFDQTVDSSPQVTFNSFNPLNKTTNYLSKIKRQVDLRVLEIPGQRRTLPPAIRAVGYVLGLVRLARVGRVAPVTRLTLRNESFRTNGRRPFLEIKRIQFEGFE